MSEKLIEALNKSLSNPEAKYRAAPFWAWNGKLDTDELRRQIRLFKRMGLGGFFMHSRVGLGTEYLGRDWFDCVKASIDEAEKNDMLAYLYDEDRWPSGAAGGLVTKEKRFRQRRLILRIYDDGENCGDRPGRLAVYAARLSGNVVSDVRSVEPPVMLEPGEVMLEICDEMLPESSWYNDQAYLDTMNPEAVRRFIEITHEKYYQEIGDKFGNTVPAIFTDEPNIGGYGLLGDGYGKDNPHIVEVYRAPWTGKFAETFRSMFGYDLIPELYRIFFNVDGEEFSTVRYHFFAVASRLFTESFTKQIGDWCGRHNIAFTGHMLCEDTLALQSIMTGTSMRHYEYMQLPGIDQLCETDQIYVTCKQLSSVAHQFGQRQRLSETYGCTGWDFPLAGHKAVGDWQEVLGINLRCPHLAWYTAAGEAKRDYPASISYQSNYAPYYHLVEDYFARINVVTGVGKEVRELLVIHPIESAWGVLICNQICSFELVGDSLQQRLDKRFEETVLNLLSLNLDFDLGDEDILRRHAKVTRIDGRPALTVGKASYFAVLVPTMYTMSSSTLELLREFAAAGGAVAVENADILPEYVDGIKSDAARKFLSGLPVGVAAIDASCRRVTLDAGSGEPAGSVLINLRENDDALALMLCNTSFDRQVGLSHNIRSVMRQRRYFGLKCEVKTDRTGVWYEMVPETGKIHAVEAEKTASGYRFITDLEALRTRIFILADAGSFAVEPRNRVEVSRRIELGGAHWTIRRSEANVLVLDHAAWQLDGGEWHDRNYINRVDDDVRRQLGERPRGGQMVQPWVAGEQKHASGRLVLRYDFKAIIRPSGQLELAVEAPETMSFSLNGVPFSPVDTGYWVDLSCRRLRFEADLLKEGANVLEIAVDYNCGGRGLEMVYLLGEFGVTPDGGTLIAVPEHLAFGDWVEQGLTNYAGNVAYTTEIDYSGTGPRLLRINDYCGAALRVLVNGVEAGVLGWEPYEIELSPWLRSGSNELTVEVIGHRRNSHGPFYAGTRWMRWTGPGQFKEYRGSTRSLVPCGLMAVPELWA